MAMAHHVGNVTKTAVLSKDLIKVDGKLFQCEHTLSRNLITSSRFMDLQQTGQFNISMFRCSTSAKSIKWRSNLNC